MKRFLFTVFVASLIGISTFSHTMKWIKDDQLSQETITALSLLNIKLQGSLVEINKVLQEKYLTPYPEINKGIPVKNLNDEEVSQEQLAEFLDYVDKFAQTSTVNTPLPINTAAIIPVAAVEKKTNEYLFELLKQHMKAISQVIIFATHEQSKEDVSTLFGQTFPDFKNFRCIVASDPKNMPRTCSQILKKEWEESTSSQPYIILTHWKPYNDTIKNALPDTYIGSELHPFTWQQRKEIYGDKNNNSQGLIQLRNLTVTVYEAIKNMNT